VVKASYFLVIAVTLRAFGEQAEPLQAPTIGLARAVALALEQNFGLLAAADGRRAAEFNEAAARAAFYPKLTPSYSRGEGLNAVSLDASQRLPWSGARLQATGTLRTAPAELGAPRSSDLNLSLSQPLLRGFGPTVTRYELENAQRASTGQERAFELQRQRLAIDVTSAFYQVVRQRQLKALAVQSLTRSESLLKASEARMAVGLASRLDVLRAELQAAQARDSMVSADAALETALERFRVLLGLAPAQPLEPEEVALPETLPAESEPLEALVARARERRLELHESRDQVRDAERTLKVSRQGLLPQVDLRFAFSQVGIGQSLSESLRRGDRRTSVLLTTSYPVERAADRAAKAVAELNVEQRQRALRLREFEVEAEVRAAVRNLQRIRKSVDLQKGAVELAEQQHRLATLRYQRGLASNFDVVDAEGSLVAARTSLVGLLTDFQVARMELLRATGELDVLTEFAS
jgi:outer membrane protein TolC